MAKIKVRVKPGQALDTLEDGFQVRYKAGDELLMDEDEAKPILGSCLVRVHKQKKKKANPPPQPITRPKKAPIAGEEDIPEDEEEKV